MANCVKCGRHLAAFSFGKRVCEWCVRYEAAQRGDSPEDATQPVMELPWARRMDRPLVTHAIFGINVAVFLGMALAGISITDPTSAQLIHWGANSAPLTMSGQWWRLLTCVFLHIGIIHIALNMWCLWNLGEMAESLYGHWTFAGVYLISGIGASVASMAWHQNGVSAGASGAIFGLAGALIASFKLGDFSLPTAHVKALMSSVVTFAVYNLAFGAISGITDNAAHIGGLVTGLALGALIALAAPGGRQYLRRLFVMILGIAVVTGAAAWTYSSHSYRLHVQRAYELLAAHKTDAAIAEIQIALHQRPDYTPARLQLAYAYRMKSQYQLAEAELQHVLNKEPKHRDALYQLADVYWRSNRMQESKDAYAKILANDANDAGAHYGLGYVLSAEHQDREALAEYQAAAKLDPELEGLQYDMGLAYAQLKMYDDAIAAFRAEAEANGDDYDLETELVKAYAEKGMTKEADEAAAKATKLRLATGTAVGATP